jgi:hypothetical protein
MKNFFRKASVKKPQWLIIYMCSRCGIDSGRTDLDGLYCFMCQKSDKAQEIGREKFTPEALFRRMATSTNRMVENLQEAHGMQQNEWPENVDEEMMLLKILGHGKDLQEEINKLQKKSQEKN